MRNLPVQRLDASATAALGLGQMILCLSFLIALPAICSAQATTAPATQPAGPTVTRLTLHPQATSQPALQYELFPPMWETKPGDAAYKYQLAAEHPSNWDFDKCQNLMDRLLEADRTKFPVVDAETLFREMISTRWIHDAARCDDAHWDTNFRNEGMGTLLPFLNWMRAEANSVAVEGRLAVAQGDFVRAQRCIQTNLSMAHQLKNDPFLVCALVARGVADMALDKDVVDWIARPGSPNLYWSLATLPSPFTDLPAVARVERASLAFTDHPYFEQALNQTLPDSQWPEIIKFCIHWKLARDAGKYFTSDTSVEPDGIAQADIEKEYLRVVSTQLPSAKQYLLSIGKTKAEVDATPDAKVVGTAWLQQYKIASDEMWKGWPLPYPTASRLMAAAQDTLNASHWPEHNLLIKLETFSPLKGRLMITRLDREIATMEIIEALRDFTARHGGSPPDALDQITDLPIPVDPVTGNPFRYHREGQVVTIDEPIPAGFSPQSAQQFILTFADR